MDTEFNDTYPNCTPYRSVNLFHRNILNLINIFLGCFLLVAGILGNSLGIYVASFNILSYPTSGDPQDAPICTRNQSQKFGAFKKLGVNQYLLKWFFSVNLINSLLLILSPILKLYGATQLGGVWVSKAWITYMAHYNYPITKPLIAFGFLVYVIFFVTQATAVLWPFHYQRYMTIKRVNIILVSILIYSIVWHLPTYLWFVSYKVLICPTHFTNSKILDHNIYAYDWRHEKPSISTGILHITAWEGYQISRELFLNIIPFIAVLSLKFMMMRRRRRCAGIALNPRQAISNATTPNTPAENASNKNCQSNSNTINTLITNTLPNSQIMRYRKQQAENQQHKKTLIVLTFEFLILVLPVSLTQMWMDFLASCLSRQNLAALYIFVTMLQFVYVSCTFFINCTFNPVYRRIAWDKCVGDLRILWFKLSYLTFPWKTRRHQPR